MPSVRVNYGYMLTLLFCTSTRGHAGFSPHPTHLQPSPVSEALGAQPVPLVHTGGGAALVSTSRGLAVAVLQSDPRPARAEWDSFVVLKTYSAKGTAHGRPPAGLSRAGDLVGSPEGRDSGAEWPRRGGRSRCLRGHPCRPPWSPLAETARQSSLSEFLALFTVLGEKKATNLT